MTLRVKTYSTSIRFPIELRPRILAAAAAECRRPTEWMREVIRNALAEAETKRPRNSPPRRAGTAEAP